MEKNKVIKEYLIQAKQNEITENNWEFFKEIASFVVDVVVDIPKDCIDLAFGKDVITGDKIDRKILVFCLLIPEAGERIVKIVKKGTTESLEKLSKELTEGIENGAIKNKDDLIKKIDELGEEITEEISKLSSKAFGEKSINHLKKYDGFNKKKTGVTGGHNKEGFMAYFTDNNRAVRFTKEVQHPDFKGLYYKEYQVSKGLPNGSGYYQDVFSDKIYYKTMYDPKVYTDEQMISWGKEALIGKDIIRCRFRLLY